MARIVVLSQYWAPENGVVQRRWKWLSELLSNQGHEIYVFAPPPHDKRKVKVSDWLKGLGFLLRARGGEEIGSATVYRTGFVPTGRSLTRRIFNQAWVGLSMLVTVLVPPRELRSLRPDLVIGTVPALPTAAVTKIAAWRFRARYIIDLRDAWPALFRESREWNQSVGTASVRERLLTKGPFQALVWLSERMLNRVLDDADGILTTSEWLALEIQKGNPSRPVATVRNVFPAAVDVRQRENGKPHGRLHVLYAGTIGRAQYLDNVVAAARICRERGLNVTVRFVGNGAAWYHLKKMVKAYEVDAQFVPQVQPSDLVTHYQWADTALVHLNDWPSLRFAVPSKTYELMQAGIHISGVVEGETARLISEFHAGTVVPPDNSIALADVWTLLAESTTRPSGSEAGRLWVERQREEKAPEQISWLINEIVGR